MTQAKNHISLTTALPKLPTDAQAWINELDPSFRSSTERVLNVVREESFIKHWQTHRADQQTGERLQRRLAAFARTQARRLLRTSIRTRCVTIIGACAPCTAGDGI
jgi:hypothetical protein